MTRNYAVTLAPVIFRLSLPAAIASGLMPSPTLIATLLWCSWIVPLLVCEGVRRLAGWRRDSRATLFVFDATWAYLTLECRTTIVEGPDVPDLSVRLFQVMQRDMPGRPPEGQIAWYGKPLAIDEFKQKMSQERRIIYEFDVIRSYGLYAPPSGTSDDG